MHNAVIILVYHLTTVGTFESAIQNADALRVTSSTAAQSKSPCLLLTFCCVVSVRLKITLESSDRWRHYSTRFRHKTI